MKTRKRNGMTKKERVFLLRGQIILQRLFELPKQLKCEEDRELVRDCGVQAFLWANTVQPFNVGEKEAKFFQKHGIHPQVSED